VTTTESPQIIAARGLPQQLDNSRWDGGVRIILQGSMQAIAKKGSMDLKAGWRADVFYGKGRKPAFVMVADSAAQVLRDVAALAEGAEL
jgi:hypothetical protein